MKRTTVALSQEQYESIISLCKQGFGNHRPNKRLTAILTLQANLGMRIGDILHLTLQSIINDGERLRLDVIEEKTSKQRTFTVPIEVYSYMQAYAMDNHIQPTQRLFSCTDRAVQKQLKVIVDYLGYNNISTHSFRKYYAVKCYEYNNNIEVVRELLQHSCVSNTQRYIKASSKEVEETIANVIDLQ